jgi:hypothetical protein
MNNANFYLLVNLVKGMFGLRSMFGIEDFFIGVDINSSTGELEPTMQNKTWYLVVMNEVKLIVIY